MSLITGCAKMIPFHYHAHLALKGVRLQISANSGEIMCRCFFLGWQICAVVVG